MRWAGRRPITCSGSGGASRFHATSCAPSTARRCAAPGPPMRAERLRGWLLRWAVLLRLGVLALPVLALAPLGALWLYETGYLLWFAAASAATILVMAGVLRLARMRAPAPRDSP